MRQFRSGLKTKIEIIPGGHHFIEFLTDAGDAISLSYTLIALVLGSAIYWLRFVAAALLVSFAISTGKTRDWLNTATTQIVALYLYISWNWEGDVITGRLQNLVIGLSTDYDEIEIVGYSIGSIFTLNYIFPPREIADESRTKIKRITTIGCPHDFISTFWPGYFGCRYEKTTPPIDWLNIYCMTDILGSNFENPHGEGLGLKQARAGKSDEADKPDIRPSPNIEYAPPSISGTKIGAISVQSGTSQTLTRFQQALRNVSDLANSIIFFGFKAHSVYWGEVWEGETNCLDYYYTYSLAKNAPPPPPTAPGPLKEG